MSLLYGPRTGAVGFLRHAQIATIAALTKRGNASIANTPEPPKILQSILIANRGEIALSVTPAGYCFIVCLPTVDALERLLHSTASRPLRFTRTQTPDHSTP